VDAPKGAARETYVLQIDGHAKEEQTLDEDPVDLAIAEAADNQVATGGNGDGLYGRPESQEAALGHQLVLQQEQALVDADDHLAALHGGQNIRIFVNLGGKQRET